MTCQFIHLSYDLSPVCCSTISPVTCDLWSMACLFFFPYVTITSMCILSPTLSTRRTCLHTLMQQWQSPIPILTQPAWEWSYTIAELTSEWLHACIHIWICLSPTCTPSSPPILFIPIEGRLHLEYTYRSTVWQFLQLSFKTNRVKTGWLKSHKLNIFWILLHSNITYTFWYVKQKRS